jgi:hypothetical protein
MLYVRTLYKPLSSCLDIQDISHLGVRWSPARLNECARKMLCAVLATVQTTKPLISE